MNRSEMLAVLVQDGPSLDQVRRMVLELAISGGLSMGKQTPLLTRLGDVVRLRTGKLDQNAAVEGGAYPFFTCAERTYAIDDFAFETEAVLLAGNGSFGVKWYSGRFNAYQRTYVIEPTGIDGRFLYYVVLWAVPRMTAADRGSTIKYLRKGDIENVEFKLPDSDEQRRLAGFLDEVLTHVDSLEDSKRAAEAAEADARASCLHALVEKGEWDRVRDNWDSLFTTPESVDDLRRAILDLAVRGRLVEQRDEDSPASVPKGPPGGIRDEGLWSPGWPEGLPQSWVRTPLAGVGEWGSGGTPKKSHPEYYGGDIPWLKIGDLNDGVVTVAETHITADGLENSSAKIVPTGSVLVAMYGSIGKAGITGIRCATNQAIAHCVPSREIITPAYLFWLIRAIRPFLTEQGKGGAQQNISQTVIKHAEVILPPLAEQHRIVARVNELMDGCDQLEACLRDLQNVSERLAESVAYHVATC